MYFFFCGTAKKCNKTKLFVARRDWTVPLGASIREHLCGVSYRGYTCSILWCKTMSRSKSSLSLAPHLVWYFLQGCKAVGKRQDGKRSPCPSEQECQEGDGATAEDQRVSGEMGWICWPIVIQWLLQAAEKWIFLIVIFPQKLCYVAKKNSCLMWDNARQGGMILFQIIHFLWAICLSSTRVLRRGKHTEAAPS